MFLKLEYPAVINVKSLIINIIHLSENQAKDVRDAKMAMDELKDGSAEKGKAKQLVERLTIKDFDQLLLNIDQVSLNFFFYIYFCLIMTHIIYAFRYAARRLSFRNR